MQPIDGFDHPYSIKTRPPCDSANLSPRHGIENETEWFDPKAFYNQKQSTKQATSYLSPLNFKSKTSIIGLPRRPAHSLRSNSVSVSVSRHQPTARLFPKWASRSVAEPGSPEVSCIGTVSPRLRLLPGEPRSPRFWSRVLKALGSRRKQAEADDPPTPASAGRREALGSRRKQDETDDPPTPASAGRREGLRIRRNQTEADDPPTPTPASARLRDFIGSRRKQAEADDPPTPVSARLRVALSSRRKQAEADDPPTPISARLRVALSSRRKQAEADDPPTPRSARLEKALSCRRKQAEADDPPTPRSARLGKALRSRRKHAEADDPPTPGSARLGEALRSRRKHAEADDPPTPGSAGRREALDGEKDESEIATPPSLGWIKKLTSGRRSEMGVHVAGPDWKNEDSGHSPGFWARQMASIGGPDRDGGARCMMMPMHHTPLGRSIS